MAEYNKQRYYWIRITDKFLTSDTVDFLMGQKDGANYVILYQLLCLKTINQNGELYRNIGEMIIPYDEEKIQRDTKWFSIDTIRVALSLYQKLGLIYRMENGLLKIANFGNMIGSQTISAAKKQEQIERRKIEGGKKVEKIPPDIDIEKDIDIEEKENITKEKERKIDDVIKELPERLHEPLREFVKMRKAIKKPVTTHGLDLLIGKLRKLSDGSTNRAVLIVNKSIANSWQGFFELKEEDEELLASETHNNDCPYCHGTGVILDRDENGEEVARICKCQKRDGVILL